MDSLGKTARVSRLKIKVLGTAVGGTKLKVGFLGTWDKAGQSLP